MINIYGLLSAKVYTNFIIEQPLHKSQLHVHATIVSRASIEVDNDLVSLVIILNR